MAEPTAPRLTSDADFAGYLKPHDAQPYFDEARKSSTLQSLGRQVPLGINGESIPVVTSKATASWVGEGGRKPQSKGTVGLKSMKPQKIAAIAVVSAEVVRANPANYIELFKADVAEAMGQAFDAAGYHGTASPFGAGMNFDAASLGSVALGTAAKTDGGIYADVNAGFRLLTKAGKRLRGFTFDGSVEPEILGAVDADGRPLFVETLDNAAGPLTSGRLLRRPAILGDVDSSVKSGEIVGYGGDFSQVVWGAVGGITYDVSTEATVTIDGVLTSLWEHNLVAIRCEAEFGFLINLDENGKAPIVSYTFDDAA